jgi:hypothetical protein
MNYSPNLFTMEEVTKTGTSPEGNIIDPGFTGDVIIPEGSFLEEFNLTLEVWQGEPWFTPLIVSLFIWTIVWDGIALWTAARNNQKNWFIAILLLNTAGIFEILYLKFWQKKRK